MSNAKMREVPVRCYKYLTLGAEGEPVAREVLDARAMLVQLYSQPKDRRAGMALQEIRAAMAVLDMVEGLPEPESPQGLPEGFAAPCVVWGAPQWLYLTEAQWQDLKHRAAAFSFSALVRCYLAFVDDVEGADLVNVGRVD